MINRTLTGLIFLIWLVILSGCSSKKITFNDIDTKKVDSLISVREINSRTISVNFGYDALTAINTDQGIVIVDAGISSGLTARYSKFIENVYHKSDFIYVINTHGHHDHTGGNSVFTNAMVIGHANCSTDVSERLNDPSGSMISIGKIVEEYDLKLNQSTPNTAEWYDNFTQKIRYQSAYEDVKNHEPIRLPDITFYDSMTLDLGNTIFEMFYFGKSHSNSDIIIYIPELKLICTGDLFSTYGRPGFNISSMDRKKCIQAIVWIQKREERIEKVIDGHGHILSMDDLKLFNSNILSRYSG